MAAIHLDEMKTKPTWDLDADSFHDLASAFGKGLKNGHIDDRAIRTSLRFASKKRASSQFPVQLLIACIRLVMMKDSMADKVFPY